MTTVLAKWRWGIFLPPLLAALLFMSGCGGPTVPAQISPQPQGQGEVTVFAASSLKDAFTELGTEFEREEMGRVVFNFGGSQTLATQLAQGARAEVFASADARNMESAIAAGVVETGTQKVLLTNRLVVAAEAGSTKVLALADLAAPGVKLVLAAENVPAGSYALQALDKLAQSGRFGANFKERVLANVVSREENVRQVVAKVELGEADAGIVYSTDAASARVTGIEIPAEYNVTARYYIAPLAGATNRDGALRFVDYALSARGQAILLKYGFGPPDSPGR